MNELVLIRNIKQIDSRQIAEWTGKEHSNVMRDIRTEIEALGEELAEFRFELGDYTDQNNQKRPCYNLTQKGIMQLAAKYDAKTRAMIIDKLEELESAKKQIPSCLIDDIDERVAVWQEERRQSKQLLLAETIAKDEAIRTKQYINDKKAATAMQTASVLKREVNKLNIMLDKSSDYSTIMGAQKLTKQIIEYKALKDYCKKNGLEVKKVKDERYGKVNSYPAIAYLEVYGIDIKGSAKKCN